MFDHVPHELGYAFYHDGGLRLRIRNKVNGRGFNVALPAGAVAKIREALDNPTHTPGRTRKRTRAATSTR